MMRVQDQYSPQFSYCQESRVNDISYFVGLGFAINRTTCSRPENYIVLWDFSLFGFAIVAKCDYEGVLLWLSYESSTGLVTFEP